MVFALLGAEGSFGVKDTADRLLPDLLAPAPVPGPQPALTPGQGGAALPARASGEPRAAERVDLGRVPAVGGGRCLRRPGRGPRAARRRAGARELPRRAASPFPLGAVLATAALVALAPLAFLDDRADLDLLDPDLRRWITYVLGVAFLGFLDDSLGRGEAAEHAARLARATRGRCAQGRLSTGAIKAIGALALAAYVVCGTGRESSRYLADVALLILATNLFNLLDLRPGRAEKALVAARRRPLPRRLDARSRSSCSAIFAGPVLVGAWFTLRERAMLGDTGSNLVGADRRRLAADDARRDRAPDRPRCWSPR